MLPLCGQTDREITATFSNASLVEVLNTLSAKGEFKLVYAAKLLRPHRITCQLNDVSAKQALDEVLQQTDIGIRWTQPNRAVLFKKQIRETPHLQGQVFDVLNNKPLSGVVVLADRGKQRVLTGKDGRFAFKKPIKATSPVTFAYPGYTSMAADLSAGLGQDLQIALQPSPLFSETMRVYPPSQPLFESGKLVGQLAISASHAQDQPGGKDLFETMGNLPGVEANQIGESGLSIRGGLASESTVYLDGIRLFHLDHAFGSISALPFHALEEVDLYKSGYPAVFGGGLSGLVNMTARSGHHGGPNTSLQSDERMTSLLTQRSFNDKFSFFISARKSLATNRALDIYDRVYERNNNNSRTDIKSLDIYQIEDKLDFSDLLTKFTFQATADQLFTVTYFAGKDDFEEDVSDNPELLTSGFFTGQASAIRNEGLSGWWTRNWSSDHTTKVGITYTKYDSNYIFYGGQFDQTAGGPAKNLTSNYDSDNRLQEQTAQINHSWQWAPAHKMTAGVTMRETRVRLKSDERINNFKFRYGEQGSQTAAYLQNEYQPSNRFQAIAGVRFIDDEATGKKAYEPRLFLSWKPLNQLALQGSWGRFHQFLQRVPGSANYFDGNLRWVMANQFINPGFAEQFSVGASSQQGHWFFNLEYFHRDQKGQLHQLSSSNFIAQGDTTINGLETAARFQKGPHSGWFSYVHTRFTRQIEELPSDQRLVYWNHPTPHEVKLHYRFQRGAWLFSSTWRYQTGKRYSEPELVAQSTDGGETRFLQLPPLQPEWEHLPNIHQLDVDFKYRFPLWRAKAEVGLSLLNLYNRTNIWHRYFLLQEDEIVSQDIAFLGVHPLLGFKISY